MDLISKEEPGVLCIQETMLLTQTKFILKYYSGLLKEEHINYRAHGEAPNFIHKTNPYQNLIIHMLLQAIAAKSNTGWDVTIDSSIYYSRSHDISEKLSSIFFQQLTKPEIMTQGFNSYRQIWGN